MAYKNLVEEFKESCHGMQIMQFEKTDTDVVLRAPSHHESVRNMVWFYIILTLQLPRDEAEQFVDEYMEDKWEVDNILSHFEGMPSEEMARVCQGIFPIMMDEPAPKRIFDDYAGWDESDEEPESEDFFEDGDLDPSGGRGLSSHE